METQKFSISKRALSFHYAVTGICRFFKTEHNAWLHMLGTIGVIALTIFFPVSTAEALALVFAIGFVWTVELFNTCIEKAMDFISTEKHPQIQLIKDMAAGAVLVAACTALVSGSIIFIPKIFL
ncbi:MAG: diacylglycerol kinase family protein [Chitinophagaceae bacterium]